MSLKQSKEAHKTNRNVSKTCRNWFEGAPTDQIRTIGTSKRIVMAMDYTMLSKKKNL